MANPKSLEARQAFIDKNPFDGFSIEDTSILDRLEGRHPCPKCGKSRKFYCYSCYIPIKELDGSLPYIKLPIKIDIIKHKREIDGKSTCGHAAILAPDDVTIYTYPNIPNYENDNAILIYPSHKAITINQLIDANTYENILQIQNINDYYQKLPKGYNKTTLMKMSLNLNDKLIVNKNLKNLQITKVVFIDSTWDQSKSIYKDVRLNRIPCVVIQNRISQFWRHQKGSPRWYLATIEAIHQFLIEIHLNLWGLHPDYKGIYNCFTEETIVEFNNDLYRRNSDAYNGQYDNLLFFFKHMYNLIHTYYEHDDLYAYKRRLL